MPEPLDPIPISALQHWRYCPRQCALIHIEQTFDDNVYTARGNALHARVDTPGEDRHAGNRVIRAMPIWSEQLGLIGRADAVEILPDGSPYPIEYKQGRRKAKRYDELQLAAQALCLEEMIGKAVPEGALFYASSGKRRVVTIDTSLRQQVQQATEAVRSMLQAGKLPPPVNDDRCRDCSLYDRCQPQALADTSRQTLLLQQLYQP
ncbi:CRISPR-associated protein Cas4 [Parachitinimonas caeni]|uniref:CRISPR-associated exonuclease Cas4 n=1 Tax=Parachitinimonas caeni TaxID=3031301 RepID=A0ABT7DZ13_9NEIS|nr:CRISPR-associated protein Cas4 [Parachitinimonas caeni]MDK2125298.1 CRISPR-associated protein Cas4 [Parachitinimonas caeni]